MTRIRLEPFGAEVECADGETVLDAVLRSGYYLRYGCGHGGCGTCRTLLVTGEVDDRGSTFALSDAARDQGWLLTCSSIPLEDCVIDVSGLELTEPEFYGGDQVATMTASIESVRSLTPTIECVRLRLADPETMAFRAGQFVEVLVPRAGGASPRAFSLANSPAEASVVELFVKRLPGGLFGRYLSSAQPGDLIRLRGPLGSLRVRPSYRKLIMIAGGSGLAPMLSMLTDLAEQGDGRSAWLFFGARTVSELYLLDRIDRLRAGLALELVPVVQQPDESWPGESGLVTDAITRRLPSLRGFDAYLCGPPPMIAAGIELVRRLGVRDPNIYYDAFVPTGAGVTNAV